MAKGWVKVKTVNDMPSTSKTNKDRARVDRIYDTIIRNTKSKDSAELKKEGKRLSLEKIKEEDSLVNAYNDKKLKSKKLIHKAENILKRREKAQEQKNGNNK